jgi:flagellar hook protein FlgE
MIGSLFAGISGLNANATAMTVIGDNIANVNTAAFKSNRSSFANVLSKSLSGSIGSGIGRGVEFWGVSPLWTQGSLENTSSATDLSINGKGFFIVQDSSGTPFYTRAGQFYLNADGDMVNPDGMIVQGYQIDSSGNLGNIGDISIPGERMSPPQVTENYTFDINLDAAASAGDTYTASQSIYDTLGNAIPMALIFTNGSTGVWTVASTAGIGNTVEFEDPTTSVYGSTLDVTFNGSGIITYPDDDTNVRITYADGSTQVMNWDFVDASGTNLGDITGFANPSNTTFQHQNGYPSGVLRGISVDEDGTVTAAYSNGQLTPTFRVALADFPSYDGLTKLGGNLYAESLASGQQMPGIAGDGRLGTISPGTLEMSNVDLAQEFVKMITTQRAFQANSRVITTSDEILNELINLKR